MYLTPEEYKKLYWAVIVCLSRSYRRKQLFGYHKKTAGRGLNPAVLCVIIRRVPRQIYTNSSGMCNIIQKTSKQNNFFALFYI